MKYYRIVMDMSYDEAAEDIEQLVDQAMEAVTDVIDDHPHDAPCVRYWAMTGLDVSEEYEELKKEYEDFEAENFRHLLDTTGSAHEFLENLNPEDNAG